MGEGGRGRRKKTSKQTLSYVVSLSLSGHTRERRRPNLSQFGFLFLKAITSDERFFLTLPTPPPSHQKETL